MKLHNLLEEEVKFIIKKLLEEDKSRCSCNKCRLDIAALALNKLEPMYVVTDEGKIYGKVKNNMNIQFNTDVLLEVAKAMDVVKNNPHHEE